MPVPPPAPPRASSGCFVGAVAVVALLGFGLLATLLSAVDDEPAAPGTTGATTAPPAGAVLLSEEGEGRLTAMLTSRTAWDLHWSFACAARPTGSGRFAIELHGAVRLSGVDERGTDGRGTERAAAGIYRLTVRSPCRWTLTAVAA